MTRYPYRRHLITEIDRTCYIGDSTFPRFPAMVLGVVAIHNHHRSLLFTTYSERSRRRFSCIDRHSLTRISYNFKPLVMGSGRSALPAYISSNANPGTCTSGQSTPSQTRAQPRPRNNPHAPRMSRPTHSTVFSRDSDPGVQDSLWFANDFMLGAGMVIIQPSTGKMVVLSDQYQDAHGVDQVHFFLPKGRKDIGESLEQTALREAYEEVCPSFHPKSSSFLVTKCDSLTLAYSLDYALLSCP